MQSVIDGRGNATVYTTYDENYEVISSSHY